MESTLPKEEKQVQYFSKDFEYEDHLKQESEKLSHLLDKLSLKEYSLDQQMEIQQIAQESWDEFYKNNQDKFFKNRNYLSFAFDLITKHIEDNQDKEEKLYLFEVGSGTGNTIVPLHDKYNSVMRFYACDFSQNAVQLLDNLKICEKAFVKDMVKGDLVEIDDDKLDFVTMIFFLSAIHPSEHPQVINKIAQKMKKGGSILFRDYGAYDLAMMRFINKKKGIIDLDKMIFQRGDKTLACFFTIEKLVEVMGQNGFECVQQEYCTIENKNIKRNLVMRRVFINAIFQKQ
ncbi:UNKNOWN [Stylonychia lemnae]|uniref:tRNA N(3)-methylcytidine methyltransferase n=1 Tax=Stylonychia lemnae TaxID=5949 RepID=A0A078B7X0_STYLE|nr:UNKNOWN [Stylonychia lemnae]|eukprot:CDW90489.1 UNKNOWN [Stylonychia lemnae]